MESKYHCTGVSHVLIFKHQLNVN